VCVKHSVWTFWSRHLLLITNQTLENSAYSLAWYCKQASNQFVGLFLLHNNQWMVVPEHTQTPPRSKLCWSQVSMGNVFWFLLNNLSTVKYVCDFVWILCNVHLATIYLVSNAWLVSLQNIKNHNLQELKYELHISKPSPTTKIYLTTHKSIRRVTRWHRCSQQY
jgi:hypothetical protein